ncbi:YicC/YloC family endoribonuclease [Clostridium sp. BJN0001]|uniref:YicC/YloC family endoribonuclease n=1 Tax=Clostridium sp. BJN0001 TaxID=2930219 RepID=UPI001FD5F3CD|nr:YicC/YloC family endoribonuclease [Clostridium sp. BJN0001]
MKSMTSFGKSQSDGDGKSRFYSVEIKSVNNRYLDINIKMPKFMLELEENFRNLIRNRIKRGKVDVFINYRDYETLQGIPVVNKKLAHEYYNCIKDIQDELGILNDDISPFKIAKFPDVITIQQNDIDTKSVLKEVTCVMNKALDAMNEMRLREGTKLKEDILAKINYIEKCVLEIEKYSEKVSENYKKRLEERLKELLSNSEIDEGRIALEVAILADKAAVDEEITRLKSHIYQMRLTMDSDEPSGRKLDFIIQEMNREANTIASKSVDLNMTNLVLEIKNTIEKIREQIQNLE